MYAYNKIYLEEAREKLGEMFDYAVNVHSMNVDEYWDLFADSHVARGLSCGDPKFIAGMSGIELFANVLYEKTLEWIQINDQLNTDRSKEYWAGYSLAKYQWYSGYSYSAINAKGVSFSEITDMYILHEAPDEKFLEIMTERMNKAHRESMLKRLRKYAGLTQKELSKSSGVSLRMIQLYEQRQNDISKAQAWMVISLASALGCDVKELIE